MCITSAFYIHYGNYDYHGDAFSKLGGFLKILSNPGTNLVLILSLCAESIGDLVDAEPRTDYLAYTLPRVALDLLQPILTILCSTARHRLPSRQSSTATGASPCSQRQRTAKGSSSSPAKKSPRA